MKYCIYFTKVDGEICNPPRKSYVGVNINEAYYVLQQSHDTNKYRPGCEWEGYVDEDQ